MGQRPLNVASDHQQSRATFEEAQGPLSDRSVFYCDLVALISRTPYAHQSERARRLAKRQVQAMLRREDVVVWDENGFFLVLGADDPHATAVAERVTQKIAREFHGADWRARKRMPQVMRPATPRDLEALRLALGVPAAGMLLHEEPASPHDDLMLAGEEARDRAIIAHAERIARALKLEMMFAPVWDMKKNGANTLFCTLLGTGSLAARCGHEALIGATFGQIAEMEIAMLRAAVSYGRRMRRHGQSGCVGTAVSYETLASAASRTRFLQELNASDPPPATKIFLTIDQVPMNAQARRIAEMLRSLERPTVIPTVHLPSARMLDRIPQPVGAAGFGLAMRGDEGADLTQMIAEIITRFAGDRGAFAWLSRLDTPAMLDAAKHAGVRFATGAALPHETHEGLGTIPALPLKFESAQTSATPPVELAAVRARARSRVATD
jgi:hypothetical protein